VGFGAHVRKCTAQIQSFADEYVTRVPPHPYLIEVANYSTAAAAARTRPSVPATYRRVGPSHGSFGPIAAPGVECETSLPKREGYPLLEKTQLSFRPRSIGPPVHVAT
jgi:hypothetical protein